VTDDARVYTFGMIVVCTRCAYTFVIQLDDFTVRLPSSDEALWIYQSYRRPAIEKIVRVLRRPRKGVAE
jgi:hypothetical protein